MNKTALALHSSASLHEEALPGAEDHVVTVKDIKEFSKIHQPGKNIAFLERRIPEGLVKFVDMLKGSELSNHHFMLAVPHVRTAIGHGIAARWPESSLGRQLFFHDLSNLAELYIRLTNARRIRVSIKSHFADDHDYFQAQSGALRLITIYRGGDIEWVPDLYVDRQALAEGEKGDLLICQDLKKVQKMPRFAIGLFKGNAVAPQQGAVYKMNAAEKNSLIVSIEQT